MLPLPNHLLNIDPENVVREIEADPLSEFVWSFRPMLAKAVSQSFGTLRARLSKSPQQTAIETQCCTE